MTLYIIFGTYSKCDSPWSRVRPPSRTSLVRVTQWSECGSYVAFFNFFVNCCQHMFLNGIHGHVEGASSTYYVEKKQGFLSKMILFRCIGVVVQGVRCYEKHATCKYYISLFY